MDLNYVIHPLARALLDMALCIGLIAGTLESLVSLWITTMTPVFVPSMLWLFFDGKNSRLMVYRSLPLTFAIENIV